MRKDKPKYKQIIEAAVVVIAENGYHQAQISKIAKQAGVADGTIYLYFKNKEDVLISVFYEKMGMFVDKVKDAIQTKRTASGKLLVMIENHFNILSADRHLATVTQLELRQSSKDLRQKINQVLKEYLNVLDDILLYGQKTGEFPKSLDIRLARQMIFGTMDETVTSWVLNEYKYQLPALAESIHDLLLNGVSIERMEG